MFECLALLIFTVLALLVAGLRARTVAAVDAGPLAQGWRPNANRAGSADPLTAEAHDEQ